MLKTEDKGRRTEDRETGRAGLSSVLCPLSSDRWIAWLFLAVALLQLAPVWAVRYYPTMDGPAHLYNAWAMRELVLRHDNAVTRTYAIDTHPYPNVLDHVVLAMLLGIFEAPVAEKVFVSAVILLFLGGMWMFAGAADPRASLFAFLAVPLAHHALLKSGFYNFSLSAALYFVIVALWWRRRDRADWQTITLIGLLLLLCYFAHPMSTVLAIGSIALLSRNPKHYLAFAPVLPLLAWFTLRTRGHSHPSRWSAWNHLTFLGQTQNIVTYAGWQLKFGAALCALTLLLMAITIAVERRRRDADVFLLILIAMLAAYMLGPESTAGGAMVLERIALFIPLLPLPWLTPRLGRAGRAAFAIVMAVVCVANAVWLARNDRRIARETTAIVRAGRTIPPDHTFFPIPVDRQPEGTFMALLWHTGEYVAIERRLVDLNNYEPRTRYFPLKYRDPRLYGVESIANDATDFPVDRMEEFAQFLFTWKMPDDAPVLARLDGPYHLEAISKDARIYRRRMFDFDEVLLPLAGTKADADGPDGGRWGVEQEVRNRGVRPATVELHGGGPFTLAPGEAKRITSDERYVVAHVAGDVGITTVVHRIDPNGTVSRLSIPSVPFSAFRRRRIEFDALPRDQRLTLRLWCYGVVGDVQVGDRTVALDANGFAEVHDFNLGSGAPHPAFVRVDAGDDDTILWGIVTATSGHDAGSLYTPRNAWAAASPSSRPRSLSSRSPSRASP